MTAHLADCTSILRRGMDAACSMACEICTLYNSRTQTQTYLITYLCLRSALRFSPGVRRELRAPAATQEAARLVDVVHDAEEAAAVRARALAGNADVLGRVVRLRRHLRARAGRVGALANRVPPPPQWSEVGAGCMRARARMRAGRAYCKTPHSQKCITRSVAAATASGSRRWRRRGLVGALPCICAVPPARAQRMFPHGRIALRRVHALRSGAPGQSPAARRGRCTAPRAPGRSPARRGSHTPAAPPKAARCR